MNQHPTDMFIGQLVYPNTFWRDKWVWYTNAWSHAGGDYDYGPGAYPPCDDKGISSCTSGPPYVAEHIWRLDGPGLWTDLGWEYNY